MIKSESEYSADKYFAHRLPSDPNRDRLWAILCTYLEKYIPRSGRVLELGGGYCSFINHVRAAEKAVVDIFDQISSYAAKDVTVHVRSCTDLAGIPNDSFDVVFASNLFEHLTREQADSTIAETHRVLASGGRLIIIQPNFKYAYRDYFDDYTHIQIFTHVSLRDYIQARGLLVQTIIPRFLPYSLKTSRPSPSWLLRLYLASPWKPSAGQMLLVAIKP